MASATHEPEAGHSGCPCAKDVGEQAVCPCGRPVAADTVSDHAAPSASPDTPRPEQGAAASVAVPVVSR